MAPMPAVPQWKPELRPVDRPAYLLQLPSPAVTSFNMAFNTYQPPMIDARSFFVSRVGIYASPR